MQTSQNRRRFLATLSATGAAGTAASCHFRTHALQQAGRLSQVFSSRLSSFQKRQSVPSARILFGPDLIKPASRSRSA